MIGSRMIRDQNEKNFNKWSLPCGHTQLISVNVDPWFRQFFFAVLQSSRWFFEVMSKFASSPAAIMLIPN